MWRKDSAWNGVPIAGHAERAMPHSRWSQFRSTPRRAQRRLAWRVPHAGGSGRATAAPRPGATDAAIVGRNAMSETKVRDQLRAIPDEAPQDNLPEPVAQTPEQLAELAEAEERDRLRQREWAAVYRALVNN